MSTRWIKTGLMTATCIGLMGLVAGDANAFCGKVSDSCCDPCADPCASSCGKKGGGLRDWFGRLRGGRGSGCCESGYGGYGAGGCGPAVAAAPVAPAPAPATQKVKVTEWVQTWVEEEVTVMKPVKIGRKLRNIGMHD